MRGKTLAFVGDLIARYQMESLLHSLASISVETILNAIANHPNFTGLAIVRSYSPDHYEGDSCAGKVAPVTEVVQNVFTDTMYSKQIMGFQKAVEKVNGTAKLRFMDITKPFAVALTQIRRRSGARMESLRHRIVYTGACQARLTFGMKCC
ncbi:protein YLS7-like protein [Carex littledalei]|uniref:Protein YLS7-like protein n=1 Tax=Carex littledalei TaxID=544730 RepID=A0A833QRB7_9POAL|nr:protein YLS7-like protein [Carex littledalei]